MSNRLSAGSFDQKQHCYIQILQILWACSALATITLYKYHRLHWKMSTVWSLHSISLISLSHIFSLAKIQHHLYARHHYTPRWHYSWPLPGCQTFDSYNFKWIYILGSCPAWHEDMPGVTYPRSSRCVLIERSFFNGISSKMGFYRLIRQRASRVSVLVIILY